MIPHSTFFVKKNQIGGYLWYKEQQSSAISQINPQLLTEKK